MSQWIQNGWFTEKTAMWPGQAMTLEVEELLYSAKSAFQDVLVFKSKTYGIVLVLDGVIQVTERDEFAYQEMIAHVPMFSHPNPERVLIVGGGDGGAVREVLKHDSVKEIVLCELDKDVIAASKKYLPTLSSGFDDPRVEVVIKDGNEYMREHENYFDVVITDSSDPVGPAGVLFEMPFFTNIKKTLKEDGILCSQGESIWLSLEMISNLMNNCKAIYPIVQYSTMSIPTYPCGQIGLLLCSKSSQPLNKPLRTPSKEQQSMMRYYNPAVHEASFTLPQFARVLLE